MTEESMQSVSVISCSHENICCFVTHQGYQWAGIPAKTKSVFLSETASMDQCPLAVTELTLCSNQN